MAPDYGRMGVGPAANVEALLTSAGVDRDGNQELDATCTFAVIATRADTGEQYGNFLSDGTWHLQVGASGTSSYYGVAGSILGNPTVIARAIFTAGDRNAFAELTASGNHVTSKATTVVVPARAKSASHVLRVSTINGVLLRFPDQTLRASE